MAAAQLSATRIVVQRYEESLQQIASLKRQNHELKEVIRRNEIKAMRLVDHYKSEIDAQTDLATRLKGELRERGRQECLKRQREFRDQGTWIEEDELQSKEQELIAIIDLLEDEIQSLKDDQRKQNEEFERRALVNQADMKQSFLQDIDAFRSQISDSVCEEVREAMADTVTDNARLKREFRLRLLEMERLQSSRDRKDDELLRTKREMELLMHRNQLMEGKMQSQINEEKKRRRELRQSASTPPAEQCGKGEDGDCHTRRRKAAAGDTLEDYFRQCIKDSQRRSARHKRSSRVSM